MPADYMPTERRLPFSQEAEQSVLGAALLDSGCLPDLVRCWLSPDRCLLPGGSAGGILRNIGSRPEPPSVPKRIPAGIGLRGFFI